jgi:hypothetical protein
VANAREEAAVLAALAGIAAYDPGLTEPDGPVYIAYLSL